MKQGLDEVEEDICRAFGLPHLCGHILKVLTFNIYKFFLKDV